MKSSTYFTLSFKKRLLQLKKAVAIKKEAYLLFGMLPFHHYTQFILFVNTIFSFPFSITPIS